MIIVLLTEWIEKKGFNFKETYGFLMILPFFGAFGALYYCLYCRALLDTFIVGLCWVGAFGARAITPSGLQHSGWHLLQFPPVQQ
jgi:hypothetical protein